MHFISGYKSLKGWGEVETGNEQWKDAGVELISVNHRKTIEITRILCYYDKIVNSKFKLSELDGWVKSGKSCFDDKE